MFERFCHIFKANVQEVQNNSVVVELSYVVLLFFLPPLFFFKKFFYFWLRWAFVAARGLSLVAASRSFAAVCGLLIAVASLVAEHGLQVRGLQLRHVGSVVVARRL